MLKSSLTKFSSLTDSKAARRGVSAALSLSPLWASLVFTACGDDRIVNMKPGPKIQAVVAQQEKANAISAGMKELQASLDSCGISEGASASSLSIGQENINQNGRSVSGISLNGELISFSTLRKAIKDLKTSLMSSGISSGNQQLINFNALQPKDVQTSGFDSPLIFRANCFELKENEVLETGGRDLYILADKVSIAGTIRTTPAQYDDYPGISAGSVYISSIQVHLDEKAQFDLRGGDAGKITMFNTSTEETRRKLIESIKADAFEVTNQVIAAADRPQVNMKDAENVASAWIALRDAFFSADPHSTEADLFSAHYDKEVLKLLLADQGFGVSPGALASDKAARDYIHSRLHPSEAALVEDENLTPQLRAATFNAVKDDAIFAFALGIAQGQIDWEKQVNKKDTSPEFFILPGRLSASIKRTASFLRMRESYANRYLIHNSSDPSQRLYLYPTQGYQYQALPGGSPGSLEISSLMTTGNIQTQRQQGASSVQKDAARFHSFGNIDNIQVPVDTIETDEVTLIHKKNTDDKFVSTMAWTSPEKKITQNSFRFSLTYSNQPMALSEHPNAYAIAPRIARNESEISARSDIEASAFRWGIQPRAQVTKAYSKALELQRMDAFKK